MGQAVSVKNSRVSEPVYIICSPLNIHTEDWGEPAPPKKPTGNGIYTYSKETRARKGRK